MLAAAAERYAAIETGRPPPSTTPRVAAGEDAGVPQLGKAQAPIRLAVTGRSVGPPLWESLELLGRDRTLARLADRPLARLEPAAKLGRPTRPGASVPSATARVLRRPSGVV